MTWKKKYENANLPKDNMQIIDDLHVDLVTAYGQSFVQVINCLPPSYESEAVPFIELVFESEPSDLTDADNLVNQYKEIIE